MNGTHNLFKNISYYIYPRRIVDFSGRVILGLIYRGSTPDLFMMRCPLGRNEASRIVKLSFLALEVTGTGTREFKTTQGL